MHGQFPTGNVVTLMTGVITNTTGAATQIGAKDKAFQAKVSGTGAVSVTVSIFGSNYPDTTSATVPVLTLSPAGTTTAYDQGVVNSTYTCFWAVTTGISGTNATVEVTAGI